MPPLHALHEQLRDLGAVGPSEPELFEVTVRDRPDIPVYRCPDTGVVLLGRIDHVDSSFYPDKDHPGLKAHRTRTELAASLRDDTNRRATAFGSAVVGRDWLDVGTGAGALLDAIGPAAASVRAVEPQGQLQAVLRDHGYDVFADIVDIADASVDVVTEFHVFEHIPDPVGHLREVRRVLRPGGSVLLEVPHARDALLTRFGSAAFRAFTVWSEHLVLHTAESLSTLLAATGFDAIEVTGHQRYPLANHLHWLATAQPGGHLEWEDLVDPALDEAYGAVLTRLGATDTLIARARRA